MIHITEAVPALVGIAGEHLYALFYQLLFLQIHANSTAKIRTLNRARKKKKKDDWIT